MIPQGTPADAATAPAADPATAALYAAVARQQRWYTLSAAVTAEAVRRLLTGAAGTDGEDFLRAVTESLETLDRRSDIPSGEP